MFSAPDTRIFWKISGIVGELSVFFVLPAPPPAAGQTQQNVRSVILLLQGLYKRTLLIKERPPGLVGKNARPRAPLWDQHATVLFDIPV